MKLQRTVFHFFILLMLFGNDLEISSLCTTRTADNAETNQHKNLRDVLNSLHKIIGFFEREYENVNLDAVYGLRIAQGILEKIWKSPQRSQSFLDENSRQAISSMHRAVSRAANNSVPYLRATTPQYYHRMRFLVSKPWRVIKPDKALHHSLASRPYVTHGIEGSRLDGRKYEACVAQLLGSLGTRPCDVTDACWGMMVTHGAIGYGLTHKALYFMFGEQRGCLEQFARHLKRPNADAFHSVDGIYEDICSRMLRQMLLVQGIKEKRRTDRDLFMEQSVVCGLLGYSEFLSKERLQDVLRWQLPSGCYGYEVPHELDSKRASGTVTMRRLLTTKDLSGGCESHITGVAVALLAVYLNWLTTPPPPPQTQEQTNYQAETISCSLSRS